MNNKKLLVTLAASAILFTGCGLKSKEAIIKVNDTAITQAQFDTLFTAQTKNNMFSQLGMKIDKENNAFMYYMIQDRVINELIVEALLQQEIEKRNIEVTKDEINASLASLMNQVGGKNQLNKILKQHGISHKQFKADIKKELSMKKLATSLGVKEVTEAEMKKYYNSNKAKFKQPEKVRASHILIAANENSIRNEMLEDLRYKNMEEKEFMEILNSKMKEKEAKANEILAQVKAAPADFAKIAKQNSEDEGSAINGGDLGFFAAEEMVPEFSKAAFALKPEAITDKPVKTKFGYHIIKSTDRMAANQQPYEKVSASIKTLLENQKQVEAIDKLVESLKKDAKIEYLNTEFDPATIQKNVDKEVEDAPRKIEAAKKKAEESAKKAAEKAKK